MQERIVRRSNKERTETTRSALIAAARALFIEKGYAETGTPELVERAGVTRGALYHHFADKEALFRAVVEAEAGAVQADIVSSAPADMSARAALAAGTQAYLAAMAEPGRTRLMLIDGPAVLGRIGMDEIDARHGGQALRTGIVCAMDEGVLSPTLPVDAATQLLSAAFDRAALAIDAGADPKEYQLALAAIMEGLAASNQV